MQSNSKKKTIYIGSAWNKTAQTRDGDEYSYVSVAFTGNRDQDEYEVVLRRKSDGTEIPLSQKGFYTKLVNNMKRTSENSPDLSLKVEFTEE